jgi:hypothetical protein
MRGLLHALVGLNDDLVEVAAGLKGPGPWLLNHDIKLPCF